MSSRHPLRWRRLLAACSGVYIDLRLMSPATSAYSAARSVPVSRLRSTCQPLDQHLSAALSAPVSRLNSTCQPLHQCLSAAGSLPSQLRDQRLLSRESAPPQPRDHSLSATLSESVIRLISNCLQVEECLLSRANCISHPVDRRLLSPTMNAYSAPRSVPFSCLRSTCQPVDQHL